MTIATKTLSGKDKNDFIKIILPYESGTKILALIKKLKCDKKPLTELNSEIKKIDSIISSSSFHTQTLCLASILTDLFSNGWDASLEEKQKNSFSSIQVKLIRPQMKKNNESNDEAKERARKGLLLGVQEYLSAKPNQIFVRKMEGINEETSILEIIDDPFTLSEVLNNKKLEETIRPIIQVVEEGKKDPITGFMLSDIWRYCRLTWSMEYKTNPGRSVRILIRNGARENHPVMGIVMLASPVISLGSRDDAMALNYSSFIKFAEEEKITLLKITQLMEETFKKTKSSISKKGMNLSKLSSSSLYDYLKNLSDESLDARKKALSEDKKDLANDLLFKSKRALKLRIAQMCLDDIKFLKKQTQKESLTLSDVDKNHNFIELVKKFLTQKRNEFVSTDVMDLSVCGAIFPYNSLLVGKLVTLLMASKEIKNLIDQKYENSDNLIASKIAGKKIKKTTSLRALTTTSLYGVGSSQYNRLKLIKENSGIRSQIVWKELRNTKGFGSFHFSRHTRELLKKLETKKTSQHVNYEFGEGTSPAMRRIKEGIETLGIDSGILQHEFERKTYLCDLTPEIRKSVFEFESKKNTLNSVSSISKAWKERYLSSRLNNDFIIEDLRAKRKEDFLISSKFKKIFKT